MNVVCVLGSPRSKGNSTQLANRFLARAEESGATIQRFELNKMKVKGCQGCYVCKTNKDYCVVNDDLADVLSAVRESDVLVMATPVYFMDVSAQMKAFIDRTFSFLDPDFVTNKEASRLAKGKKMVFIQTQHQGEGLIRDIFDRYSPFFKFYGFEDCRYIHACHAAPVYDIQARKDLLEAVDQAAQAVFHAS